MEIFYKKSEVENLENNLQKKSSSQWDSLGKKNALELFRETSKRVPAYKKFLKKHGIDPKKIKTFADFEKIPLTDKKNYIQAYPLHSRCWDGKLSQTNFIAASSGTTGQPTYWPRAIEQELEAALTHELLYKKFFEIHEHKSLILIGFPMGVYVSGMATALPSWLIAQKYSATIMSIGNNKNEILRAVKNLGHQYDQIILVGHPFFIKDVIETGLEEKLTWKKFTLKFMFCSEGFSETWREYLLKKTGTKLGYNNCISLYGSSELLLMAFETPFTIRVKQLAEKSEALSFSLFGKKHAPNIFQYNPVHRYIEEIKKELIFTSNSGVPLIRFNLHDTGVLRNATGLAEKLNKHSSEWKKPIIKFPMWDLPVIAMWGRSDYTVVFYAANIYPEHIHSALHKDPFLNVLTGKFTLRKGYKKNMDEFLEINLELKKPVQNVRNLELKIQTEIFEKLKKINMEFLDASLKFPKKIIPEIKLWPYQHSKYFRPGLKPKYII